MTAVRIGTRRSALALAQTQRVADGLRALDPGIAIEIVHLTTAGDDLPDAPLERMEGTGFFTSTLERALLAGEIDLAVHSGKDLPTEPVAGLVLAAVLPRASVEDVLCAHAGCALADLPAGARIGTSSPRRAAQIRRLRPDARCEPLRGNVPTRLARVERGELAGIVLARAGLERLGLLARVTQVFTTGELLPAPAQGAMVAQCRADDAGLAARLAPLDDAPTRRAIEAERAVLHALRGGCSVPVGALARETPEGLALEAGVFDPEGGAPVRARAVGDDPGPLGRRVAALLLERGAGRVLEVIGRAARIAAPEAR